MKVHLRLPEGQEAAVQLNLIPRTGESIEFGGARYVIASVVHSVETARTTLELVRITVEDGYRTIRLNDLVRYRNIETRSFSPARRARF